MSDKSQRPLRSAWALLALASLAACANLASEPPRADAALPAQFPVATGSAAAAPLAWQDYYRDERLRALISLALKNNRDLRVALLNVEQARAQARITAASQWPTVGAGLAANRQPDSSGKNATTYQAGLQITAYELDLLGKLRNNSDAASARYLATRSEERRVGKECRL